MVYSLLHAADIQPLDDHLCPLGLLLKTWSIAVLFARETVMEPLQQLTGETGYRNRCTKLVIGFVYKCTDTGAFT